jgi:chemotaxis-related protein WspB
MLFLLFYLGSDRYAIEASKIVEILPLIAIKKVLRSRPGIIGLINYHGALVPVIDLAELALGCSAPPRLSTRIILARCSDEDGKLRLLALVAEKATETMRCEPEDFVSSGVTDQQAPYLGPIAMGPRGFVQRIEVSKLLPASIPCALLEQCA